jgi:hypothetical protein
MAHETPSDPSPRDPEHDDDDRDDRVDDRVDDRGPSPDPSRRREGNGDGDRGLGPYRTSARLAAALPRKVPPIAIVIAISLLLSAVFLMMPAAPGARLGIGDAPPILLDSITTFPPADADLPPSTPLSPLLVADSPDSLAVLAPAEGATRVVRGQALSIRFNRPMVRGSEIGREVAETPIVTAPPVSGIWRWSTRSTIVLTPSTATSRSSSTSETASRRSTARSSTTTSRASWCSMDRRASSGTPRRSPRDSR